MGLAATDAGYRTYFTAAAGMVAALEAAHLGSTAAYKLRTYLSPSVLVIDELGYLSLDQASANWIFQVVSRRYDKGSIVLTSNRGFGDWNQVFATRWWTRPSSTGFSTAPPCSTSAAPATGYAPTSISRSSREAVLWSADPPRTVHSS